MKEKPELLTIKFPGGRLRTKWTGLQDRRYLSRMHALLPLYFRK